MLFYSFLGHFGHFFFPFLITIARRFWSIKPVGDHVYSASIDFDVNKDMSWYLNRFLYVFDGSEDWTLNRRTWSYIVFFMPPASIGLVGSQTHTNGFYLIRYESTILNYK